MIKDWELVYNDGSEYEYVKKLKWKNAEIEGILEWNEDLEVTKEELVEIFDKIIINLDFLIEKSKNKIVEEFIDYANYGEKKYGVGGFIDPKSTEIYYINYSLDEVEKKIIGDT